MLKIADVFNVFHVYHLDIDILDININKNRFNFYLIKKNIIKIKNFTKIETKL